MYSDSGVPFAVYTLLQESVVAIRDSYDLSHVPVLAHILSNRVLLGIILTLVVGYVGPAFRFLAWPFMRHFEVHGSHMDAVAPIALLASTCSWSRERLPFVMTNLAMYPFCTIRWTSSAQFPLWRLVWYPSLSFLPIIVRFTVDGAPGGSSSGFYSTGNISASPAKSNVSCHLYCFRWSQQSVQHFLRASVSDLRIHSLVDRLEHSTSVSDDLTVPMVYVCRSFEPTPIRHVEAVDRDMLVLPDAVIDELEENVRQTLSGVNIGGLGRRKTYNALLHGEPGTCKSTAIEFVAHKVRAHILLVPSNNFHLVAEFRSKISGRALVVLEDVHTQQFRRTVSSRSQRSVEEEDDEQTYDLMSVVLGTLDGLESIPGTVFLFTANREWVRPPPAELLRRFHGLFHFTHPTVEEVRPFLQKVLQGIASEKRDEYVNAIVKVIENSKEHSDKFVVRTDDHPRKGVSTSGKALMRVKMYALKEALRFAISRSKDGDLSLSLFQLKWVNLHEGVARSQAHLADA